jgi:hypothetical protein
LGSVGTIVIVHCVGTLDLLSCTDRTWPVIVDPADRIVAVLPLNYRWCGGGERDRRL